MITRRDFLALPITLLTPTPTPDTDIDDIKAAIQQLAAVVLNMAYIIDYNAAATNYRLDRLERLIGEVRLPDTWQA